MGEEEGVVWGSAGGGRGDMEEGEDMGGEGEVVGGEEVVRGEGVVVVICISCW